MLACVDEEKDEKMIRIYDAYTLEPIHSIPINMTKKKLEPTDTTQLSMPKTSI